MDANDFETVVRLNEKDIEIIGSLFAEYLYINLGPIDTINSVAVFSGPALPSSFTAHFSDVVFNVVRVGLN